MDFQGMTRASYGRDKTEGLSLWNKLSSSSKKNPEGFVGVGV